MPLKKCSFMRLRGFTSKFTDNKGFTLAELLATMSVFAIVAAIAVPSFLSFQSGMRLNGGARQVLSRLMWARSQAIEQNTVYIVTFPTDHTMQIFNDANANDALDAGEWNQTVDIQTDYPEVSFSIGGSSTTPKFNGRGTATADTTITITNTSGSKQVQVRATGNVKVI